MFSLISGGNRISHAVHSMPSATAARGCLRRPKNLLKKVLRNLQNFLVPLRGVRPREYGTLSLMNNFAEGDSGIPKGSPFGRRRRQIRRTADLDRA
jgi:hypothetical protein